MRTPLLMSITLLAALLSAAPGCQDLPIPADLDSGITGAVVAGPQCPVVGPDSGPDCADQPLAATVVVKSADSRLEVTRFTTGADGRFRVPLYPGQYWLDPLPVSPTGLPLGKPRSVTVVAGQFTEITVQYDTGIR